jgi:hypothetical protein
MPQQDQPRIRKALLAGAVALALTGTGAAIAWSAESPWPSPSESAPGQENRQDKQDRKDKPARPDKSQRSQLQHSEGVVKKADGTFQAVLEQRGTVEAVSETSITVKSEDGFSHAYAVNAETKIIKVPAPAADGAPATGDDGKRLRPSDGTIADITTGEVVRISAAKNGDQATAERIVEGAANSPGLGLGQGKGLGKGHGRAN